MPLAAADRPEDTAQPAAGAEDAFFEEESTETETAVGAVTVPKAYFAEQWPAVTAEEAGNFADDVNDIFDEDPSDCEERCTLAPEGASASDRAYPYPSSSEDRILEHICDNYPQPSAQDKYGISWAGAATALAGIYMAGHGMADSSIDLSELHTAWWSYHTGTSSLENFTTGDKVNFTAVAGTSNFLNAGGNFLHAFQTFYQRGAASENVLPISDASLLAAGGSAAASGERNVCAHLKTSCRISIRNNSRQLKGAIISFGAAGAGLCGDSAYLNVSSNAFYCSSARAAEQAVLILGWDDDFPKESFGNEGDPRPSVSGAWLVRDLTKSGNAQFYWVSYEDNSLTDAWVLEMSGDEYDNRYDMDSQIHGLGGYFNSARGYANIYTVCGDSGAGCEDLEAVRFEIAAVRGKGAKYTLRIYTDVYGDMPFQGKLAAEYRGRLCYAGDYTVKLPSPLTLRRGSRFSIVLVFDQTGSTVTLEKAISANSCIFMRPGSQAGQSFVSTDGLTFSDINGESNDHGNLVISALTNDRSDLSHPSYMSVDPASLLFTEPYDEEHLSATVWDEELKPIEEAGVSWYSGNSNVAEVDENGLVTAVKNGSCFIYARCEELEAHCIVTVNIPYSQRVFAPNADVKEGQSIPWNEELHLKSFTDDAQIYYTLDGSEPTRESSRYNSGIPLQRDMTGQNVCLKAFAVAEGMQDSEVMCVNFLVAKRGSIQLSASPKNEIILSEEGNVTLNAALFTDGAPALPQNGFHFEVSDPAVILLGKQEGGKIALIGLKNGSCMVNVSASNILGEELHASVSISVNIPKTAVPRSDTPDGTTLSVGDVIRFTSDTPGAKIYCTVDGTVPSTASIECVSGCFAIGSSLAGKRFTLQVAAIREGRLLFSDTLQLRLKIRRGDHPVHSALDPVPVPVDKTKEDGSTVSALYLIKGQRYESGMKGLVSSDKKAAKSTKSGRILAAGPGRAQIRQKDGEEVLYEVTVIQPLLSDKNIRLATGESYRISLLRQLKEGQEILDLSADYPDIYWYSTNEEVARVTDGFVTAIAKGSCRICACINGKTLQAKLSVKDIRSYGKLSDGDCISLNALQSLQLKTTDFKISGARWSGENMRSVSNNKGKLLSHENDIVRITSGGKLTAIGCGKVYLTATDKSDPEKTFHLTVDVQAPPQRELYMTPGDKRKLSFYGVKQNTAHWTVIGDESVVLLSDRGKITALTEGECVVSCSCDPYGTGGFVWRTRVHVCSPELKCDSCLLKKGKNYSLNMKMGDAPLEAEWERMLPQDPLWKSSRPSVAFVDEYGCIHARGKGKAVISARICNKTVSIRVTVGK
ncbi:MAG: chitobiase/beta-hexosaminidase C-terminal domain-containing protein [Lachnospiraceae bacterium]|nr:chitobiase/beta-hexosaminidase C-terminal domain-containing protein [Lachnospiraceae bacterium]